MISALVSAYYAEEYLDRRIINLRDTPDVEIIVVCQEGSAEQEIARWYQVLTITTTDIPTIGKAWNLGIRAANGAYLTTANADDEFYPGALATMAQALDNRIDYGLVFSDVDVSDDAGVHPWKRVENAGGYVDDLYQQLMQRCFIGPMPLWRSSLHAVHGMFDEDLIVSCDYDFWLRLAKARVGFVYIPRALGLYNRRDMSLEHRNKGVMAQERHKILERYKL